MGFFTREPSPYQLKADAHANYNAALARRNEIHGYLNEWIGIANTTIAKNSGYIATCRQAFNEGKMKMTPKEFYDLIDRNERLIEQGVELDDIAEPVN